MAKKSKPAASPAPAAAGPQSLSELVPDSRNPRRHTERNIRVIRESLKKVGPARSIVIDEDNKILAGNGVTTAAMEEGINKVLIVDAPKDAIVAVRKSGLTDKQKAMTYLTHQ